MGDDDPGSIFYPPSFTETDAPRAKFRYLRDSTPESKPAGAKARLKCSLSAGRVGLTNGIRDSHFHLTFHSSPDADSMVAQLPQL